MTLVDYQTLFSIFQSLVTTISIIIAGLWAYNRFIIQQERYPNLIFTADISIIGQHKGETLVEIISFIENKGKTQHKMDNFNFDISAIYRNEELVPSPKWGNQIDFYHTIANGSFLPLQMSFFFVDPGTTAKYSYITKLPSETAFAILHCTFNYADKRNYLHTAEKIIKIN